MNRIALFASAAAICLLTACSAAPAASPASSAPMPAASAASGSMAAASGSMAAAAVTKITPEEAKAMMDKGGVTVVDVRRQDEYDAGHIANAVLVPNESIGDTAPAALPDKDATLLLYCRSGHRSAQAAAKLAALGYTHVYDFGGINSWPYDVVTD